MHLLRSLVGSIPVVGKKLGLMHGSLAPFRSTQFYWDRRYQKSGNSGAGSYGQLARFKADVINRFVQDHNIASVVEFGCGDGAQLGLAHYPRYIGIDVSPHAVALCTSKFAHDPTKTFFDLASGAGDATKADMAMSLDVIYHLVEDETYHEYMRRLFGAAHRFVCVYSSNVDLPGHVHHIRHHCFTDWIERQAPGWSLIKKIRNSYPYNVTKPEGTSWADFYFFGRS